MCPKWSKKITFRGPNSRPGKIVPYVITLKILSAITIFSSLINIISENVPFFDEIKWLYITLSDIIFMYIVDGYLMITHNLTFVI